MSKFVQSPIVILLFILGLTSCSDNKVHEALSNFPYAGVGGIDTQNQGKALFTSCASCHMPNGSGRVDGTIPNLAGRKKTILSGKLTQIKMSEKWLPVMAPFAKALSSNQIELIAFYLSTLEPPKNIGQGPIKDPSLGQKIYLNLCIDCHLLDEMPQITGQHFRYIQRKIREFKTMPEELSPMITIAKELSEKAITEVASYLSAQKSPKGSEK